MTLPNEKQRRTIMLRKLFPIDCSRFYKKYLREDMAKELGMFLIEKGLVNIKEVYGDYPEMVEAQMELTVIAPEGWGDNDDAG